MAIMNGALLMIWGTLPSVILAKFFQDVREERPGAATTTCGCAIMIPVMYMQAVMQELSGLTMEITVLVGFVRTTIIKRALLQIGGILLSVTPAK